MRRALAPLFTLAVLAGLVELFRFAQRYDPSTAARRSRMPDVSITLEDATLASLHAGKPRWSVHANRIDVLPMNFGSLDSFRSARFAGIRAGALYRNGLRDASFSADEATFDQASRRLDVSGHLRIQTGKGDHIEAPECIWSESEDAVRLPRGGSASFRGNRMHAPYLVYSPKQHQVQCPQGVDGIFDGYPLRAAAIDWKIDARTVHCAGPVSGERRALTYTAEQDAWLDLRRHSIQANKDVAILRIDTDADLSEGSSMLSSSARGRALKGTVGALAVAAAWPAHGAHQNPNARARAGAAAPEKKQAVWTVVSDSMEYVDPTGENKFTNVTATSDQDTVIHCDLWKGNDKKKTAQATGNLKMTDPQADVTSLTADVDYSKGKRILVLSGDVVMFVKPKKKDAASAGQTAATAVAKVGPAPVTVEYGKATVPSPTQSGDSSENSRDYPVTITCDKLEYEYARNKKHAILTGHLKAVQKLPDNLRTITAEHAEWFGLEDRLVLYPPVHGEDTKGIKSFDSEEPATIFTKEGDERLSIKHGKVVYQSQDEDLGPGESKPTAKAPPTKPPAGQSPPSSGSGQGAPPPGSPAQPAAPPGQPPPKPGGG